MSPEARAELSVQIREVATTRLRPSRAPLGHLRQFPRIFHSEWLLRLLEKGGIKQKEKHQVEFGLQGCRGRPLPCLGSVLGLGLGVGVRGYG